MSEPDGYERPYAGLEVVDMSQGLAGPACGSLLAAHGATVIKIEPPEGDWARGMGTRHGDHSALEMAVNRGKRSIALDLKSAGGLAVATKLVARCDVFIESFRPGVTARLGLGYEQVKASNPRILYVSVSGFGQSGPYAARPSTDTVGQAFSGIMALNRDDRGQPFRVGFVLVDTVTSLYAFQAVATSLHARRSQGRHIDVSLMQSAAAIVAPNIIEHHLEGGAPRPLNVTAGSYRTKDGWIAITSVKEAQYEAMCRVLGRPDLATEERFADHQRRADAAEELLPILREIILTRTTADWKARFAAAQVLCNEINDFSDWLADPHVAATEAAPLRPQAGIGDLPVARIPGLASTGANLAEAPVTGEHGPALLREIGYSEAEIAALIKDGAVGDPERAAAAAG
ncbi:MAG: CoA transferase [Alphaproteobacteria bacterium]|nr:CoA transferase [Alphaproteobacteria bacterium]MDP6517395.1 CoA transferase [Alphaproteobacteria bacterium]